MYKEITLLKKDGIATITINRENKLNALNNQTFIDLNQAFDDLKVDDTIKVILITGAGQKAFVAGADIKELSETNPEEALFISRRGQDVFNKIESFSKPVIAVINGFALGGGCELAMACHIRLASENARFGQPEITLGLIPGYGGTQRLPRYIGKGKALELLLTGDMLNAQQALEIGLVNHVYTSESLMDEALKMASILSSKSALTMSKILLAVTNGLNMPLKDANEYESSLFGLTFSSEDAKEGTRAFLEKRSANFQGK